MHINLLKYIFSHPILAASIVGGLIHVGKWLNYTMHGVNYFDNVTSLINIGTTFFIIDVTMPFLIPFIVITVSRYIAKIKEEEFYETFPDMNPDIIIKCDKSGTPIYMNECATQLLRELNIPNEKKMLIPEGIARIEHENNIYPCKISHIVLGKKIEYTINKSKDHIFFLSGRIN